MATDRLIWVLPTKTGWLRCTLPMQSLVVMLFLEAWFDLNLNMRNVLAAHTARRLGWDPANYVVGEGPVVERLRSDKTKDFVVYRMNWDICQRLCTSQKVNIAKRERIVDLFKWNWLEEQCFRNVFDIERLLCFYLQLSIVERWVKLDETTRREYIPPNCRRPEKTELQSLRRIQAKSKEINHNGY